MLPTQRQNIMYRSLTYCYPTSELADRLGLKNGGYIVERLNEYGETLERFTYQDLKNAFIHFGSIDLPIHKWSFFGKYDAHIAYRIEQIENI